MVNPVIKSIANCRIIWYP